ncbi:MAG: class I SAM-dependent RNA methyltransferase [Alphaproteobacteria bacterium]|nr:class I SAM-dependent RNA methyltransferase [Alphaproteobacteria bacterium]
MSAPDTRTAGPLCVHFGTCGGCAYQDRADAAYRALKRDAVVRALERHGVEAKVGAIVTVPPGTRRRCVFKIKNGEVGFHARASHAIVDMRECRVLTPGLMALAQRLRDIAPEIGTAEVHATETGNGFDLLLRWQRKSSPALVAFFAGWAAKAKVARVVSGNDVLVERTAPMSRIADVAVRLPPAAFLQPTREGEALLQDAVTSALKGAKNVVDLFAGCGTFSFAQGRQSKVHAVELDGAMLKALGDAARGAKGLKPIATEKRDLFKRPLLAKELAAFDAAVLDPPRAGAAAQTAGLAKSKLARIVYVSCDAASFARDARMLVDGGWQMGEVTPVDQFLWSEHIELVASFARR